ncbi:Grancalcin [Varanus komodoensis]|nr:Grancalcin [Varanus komodoensis]
MTYPGFGAYGTYRGQMPMQMAMGQPVPGGVPSVVHGVSPGYSVYSGAYAAAAAADPLWTFFSAIAGQDGEVDAEELQRCLTQSGINGTYSRKTSLLQNIIQLGNLQNYDIDVGCILEKGLNEKSEYGKSKDLGEHELLHILALNEYPIRDNNGKMGYSEFKELWAAVSAWKQNFMMIDQDRSGTVELHELTQVIIAMGYRLSPQTLIAIVKRYSKNGRIFFDDYMACCVKLRALTGLYIRMLPIYQHFLFEDFFRRRDSMQQGIVNLVYDDFLQCTMAI